MAKNPEKRSDDADRTAGMSGYHKAVLALIVFLLLGSVGARAWMARGAADSSTTGSSSSGLEHDLLPGLTGGETAATPADQEPDPLEDALPAVTEGSFFALIGFALGYTTRKVFKLGLILLALGFVSIQLLVHLGVVEVDWNGMVDKLNQWVLNVREEGTVQELLTDRIPTASGLGAGWLLGLKRG